MFRFNDPTYLYLLLIVPFIVILYIYSNYRRKKNIKTFGDPDLVKILMPDVSAFRPFVKFLLLLSAFIATVFLIARPQFGTKQETITRRGIEVIIALDISNSMMAQDVTPNRLARAKQLVSRLVDEFENDKVGLVIFAGDAFVQLPITSDYISAKMFLETINPSLIATQGTAIGKAIDVSMRSFTPQENVGRAIVLITDGENHEGGALEAAKRAVEAGVQIFVLGIGSPEGSPIPIAGTNDYMRDRDGNVVVTQLNEQMCQEIAMAGNGAYIRVDNSNSAQRALSNEVNRLAKADIETKVFTDFNEQFPAIAWITLVLLILDVLIMNRKNPIFKNIKLFH